MKHMKKVLFIASFMLAAVFCVACAAGCSDRGMHGSGKTIEKKYDVGYFSRIESTGAADVEFVQGKGDCSVRVVGSKNLVDNILVERKGETLVLTHRGRGFDFSGGGQLTVYVSSPDLVGVDLRGSGDFSARGSIDTDTLAVAVFGSGDVDFNRIVCDNVRVDLRGSGDMDIKSLDCMEVYVDVFGSGDMEMKAVKASSASFNLRGSGDMDVVLSDALFSSFYLFGSGDVDAQLNNCGSVKCQLRGSGDITLKGNAKTLESSKFGSGDIHSGGLSVRRNQASSVD